MKQRKTAGEAVRFVIVGTVATAVHYAIYYALLPVLNESIAYTIGYLLSFLLNFYLTARFTFRTSPSWGKLFGMGGAHLVNYLIHITLLNLFLWLGVRNDLAPLPVFAIAIPVNFFLVRYVFNRKK